MLILQFYLFLLSKIKIKSLIPGEEMPVKWIFLIKYRHLLDGPSPSFPSLPTYPFLTCCEILQISFEAMSGRTAFIDDLLVEVFGSFTKVF